MRRLLLVVLLSMVAGDGWSQTFEIGPAWIEPESFYGGFGWRVAMLDADGNGYADVVVSGPFYTRSSPSTTQYGAVLFYPGSSEGLPDWHTWAEVGSEPGTTLGWHLATGDINGDNRDDLVFSSGSGFGGGSHQVHVRFGSTTGLGPPWDFDTGLLFGALGPTLAVGDLNGDGFDDVVAGFAQMDGGRGRLVAFHGSQSGLPAVPDWEKVGSANQRLGTGMTFVGDVYDDGYGNLLVCDGADQLMIFRGSATGLEESPSWTHSDSQVACDSQSTRLAAAGDVNGDGFDDFVVGIVEVAPGGEYDRGVQVFGGSASGPVAQVPLSLDEDSFGFSCSTAGDVNGDGFSDLVVGAPYEADAGSVYLLMGSPVGLQPAPVWSNEPVPDSSWVGWSLASGGDVNGDGLTDLVVGDPNLDHGRGLLFHGLQPFASGPAGTIYPGSSALRLRRNLAEHVVLSWGASCAGHVEDYAIYRGSLGDFGSHSPVTCHTNGSTTWSVESGGGDQYYLIVPRTLDAEGSYGKDGEGNERAPSLQSCAPQSLLGC